MIAYGEGREDFQRQTRSVSVEPENGKPDTRSPLERFRTPPKKPMSVTDIISPAWCELQYWYSLTKYGKIRATPAMKQGSSVHKVLEEQVHKEVRVEVLTKEDAFGLRLWNIIQGLRTLRATGMTRELEVFGVVEGQVMIGIIDEINARCPDEEAEGKMLEEAEMAKTGKALKRKSIPLGANQRTLTDYLTGSQNGSVLEESLGWMGRVRERPRTLYLVDVKTRGSRSLPSKEGQLRPTKMQLMMYRRLLAALSANEVPAGLIFERYKLDGDKTFSDTFIGQMAQLDMNFPEDATMSDDEAVLQSSQDSVDELLAHNNLNKLWSFMVAEFAKTLRLSSSYHQPTIFSDMLTVEYRSSGSGSVMGKRSFTFDESGLDAYVADEMRWWRGERETKGVDVEEAYKCRTCEFAEKCTWRIEKIEEATNKARLRHEGRRKSEI